MTQQVPLNSSAQADLSVEDGVHEVLPDLSYVRAAVANVIYFGAAGAKSGDWVLIDAGAPGTASLIVKGAKARFGADSAPAAIILTHGHFDHVGGLTTLAEMWNVPIFAHELELPYLNGRASYPPPDPKVGGGLMSLMSPIFPRGPYDFSRWLKPLPIGGSVPFMEGWRWIFTPGHTTGHVSLWRESDRTIIAGDAFITTAQESAYAALTQASEMHGPPMYYTQDWAQSKASVELLAALGPEIAITGHGRAMQGGQMREALHRLAQDFDQVAVPDHGKYAKEPANLESGTAYRSAK